MILLKNTFKHLRVILEHKYWVFYCGRRFGIGWLTFWHDLSKFHPVEFCESVKYYTGIRSPIDECKEAKGYSLAWQHHKGHNPHHYEYWQDNFDKGTTQISMPDKYVREMFCDFLAAGRAYNGKTFKLELEYLWWSKRSATTIAMHPNQFHIINCMMQFINNEKTLRDKDLTQLTKQDWNRLREYLDFLIKEYNN